MVTHDPEAAAIADRIVFIADGRLVHDVGKSTPDEIVRTMEELRT
jgi:putative ABC transport system ATP-binding protein